MTREQLIAKRKAKKRTKRLIYGCGAAAVVLISFVVAKSIVSRPKKRQEIKTETPPPPVVEEYETDTAVRKAVSSSINGQIGWNVNASGWFYLNDDNTIFTSGWKTIDGQRYYFKDSGYMATGWVNTGEVKDRYFDETGRLDPTKYQKLVALTYDDGPAEAGTDKVLDALEKYGQKATFFIVGEQAAYYSDRVKREYDLGMELGNHTYDHPWLNSISQEEVRSELQRNDDLIREITGVETTVIRPTGGGISADLINAVDKPMIQWDVDTLDWEHKDADKTYQRTMELVKDGSIVLMHDLFSPAGDSADRMISSLVEQGFKCVTVSELAEAYGYEMEPGGQYYAFYPEGCELNRTKAEGLESPKAAWDE